MSLRRLAPLLLVLLALSGAAKAHAQVVPSYKVKISSNNLVGITVSNQWS